MTHRPLSRLAQQPNRRRTLAVAAIIGIAANLLLVATMAQMALVWPDSPPKSVPVMAVNVVPPPKPKSEPPPPAEPLPTSTPAPPPALPAPPPLPALELPKPPAVPDSSALALPRFELGTRLADIPAVIPKFSASGPGINPAAQFDNGWFSERSQQMQTAAMITPPQLISSVSSSHFYPRTARQRGIEGRTSMQLAIGSDGRANTITILESQPPGVFDEAAKKFARELKFRPAMNDGQPIAGSVTVELIWRLDDRR